LPAE
jgi:hypothetical protein